MDEVLFLDIEADRKGHLTDFGALRGTFELHEPNCSNLAKWIQRSSVICGHNIIKHDIPELKARLGEALFVDKKYIDTLLWSPLLFSENPYHSLVKGYKIVNDTDANNPLSDCKLTKKLLLDELNAFHSLGDDY